LHEMSALPLFTPSWGQVVDNCGEAGRYRG
jgi:hypothetical protein